MNRGEIIPFSKHSCPSCGRPMRLIMAVPRFGSLPELLTYACKSCNVTYTEAAKDGGEHELKDQS